MQEKRVYSEGKIVVVRQDAIRFDNPKGLQKGDFVKVAATVRFGYGDARDGEEVIHEPEGVGKFRRKMFRKVLKEPIHALVCGHVRRQTGILEVIGGRDFVFSEFNEGPNQLRPDLYVFVWVLEPWRENDTNRFFTLVNALDDDVFVDYS